MNIFTYWLSLVVLTSGAWGAVPSAKLDIRRPGAAQPEEPVAQTVVAWANNRVGPGFGAASVPVGLSGVVDIAAGGALNMALKQDGSVVAWGYDYDGRTNVPAGLSDVVAIAVGDSHSVALKQDGSVVAWGRNYDGQTNVPAGLTGVVAIAAGGTHTVALRQDGSVFAWGSNYYGQTHVRAGLSGVVAVAAGNEHTVALKQDGSVVAWGRNSSGQISVPAGLRGVMAIVAGYEHTVALKRDGSVAAWGRNAYGQTRVPAGLTGVVAIAAGGAHTVALKQDGSVVGWGFDYSGQSSVPAGLRGVVSIKAGYGHTVALVGRPVVEMGSVNAGQTAESSFVLASVGGLDVMGLSAEIVGLQSDQFSIVSSPLPPALPTGATASLTVRFTPKGTGLRSALLRIHSNDPSFQPYLVRLTATAMASEIAVLDAAGRAVEAAQGKQIVAWGDNEYGQTSVPAGLTGGVAIAAGGAHTVALKQDGSIVAGGHNFYGQSNVPAGLSGVVAIAAGGVHSLVLKQDGSVIGWGANDSGQISVPTGLGSLMAISAGGSHTVAVKQNGSVVAWGYNGDGETSVPAGLSGVVAISAGGGHTVALKQDGSVVAWGNNSDGQATVAGLSGVVAIAAGGYHTVALKQDGNVVAWGDNLSGQSSVPAGLSGVVAIAAGGSHTVALKQDGSVVAWGYNRYGQSTVPAGLSGVVAIAAGGRHTVALVEMPSDFASYQLGRTRDHKLLVANNGNLPLALSASIEGPDSDQFSLPNPLLKALTPFQTGALTVRFSPTRLGDAHATLKITSSDPETPVYTLDLTGTGTFSLAATKSGITNSALTYGPPATDSATGLILQKLTFVNPTGVRLNGLRLIISNLAAGVTVRSGSVGEVAGTVEVIYGKSIAAGETVTLTLSYADPKRRASLQPSIRAESLAELEPRSEPVAGTLVSLLGVRDTANGPFLEWSAKRGAVDVVEYSDDAGKTWFSAVHRLTTSGTRMVWVDRGQPETYTRPANKAARQYRVKRL